MVSKKSWTRIVGLALWGATTFFASTTAAQSRRVDMDKGLVLYLSTLADSARISVRLDVGLGLDSETRATAGQAAGISAWLLRGSSKHLAPGELEKMAHRAGLSVDTQIGLRSTSLVISGHKEGLMTALWLLTQRLRPNPSSERPIELKRAIWRGVEHLRNDVVAPEGNIIDTAAAATLGQAHSHSHIASRIAADRLSAEKLTEHVHDGLRTAARRIIVIGDESSIQEALELLEPMQLKEGFPPFRDPGPAVPSMDKPRKRPPLIPLSNLVDQRIIIAAGWDLRGAARAARFDVLQRDAVLLTLETWLNHPGSQFQRNLVADHGFFRNLQAEIRYDGLPVLLVHGELREDDIGSGQMRLREELEGLVESPIRTVALSGAAEATAQALALRWMDAPMRGELLAALLDSGRLAPDRTPETWLREITVSLRAVAPRHVQALMKTVLTEQRSAWVALRPEASRNSPMGFFDEDMLDTYLRLLVDLRCPPGDGEPEIRKLLQEKYRIAPHTYVSMTRSISKRPDLVRRLTQDAHNRCEEYEKLRKVMSQADILRLHERVACQAPQSSTSKRRQSFLAATWRKFDIDPSWYWPLVQMLRQDPNHAQALAKIDARCGGHRDGKLEP
jgi:hypothetical protein